MKNVLMILFMASLSFGVSAQTCQKASKKCCTSVEACAKAKGMSVEECKALCKKTADKSCCSKEATKTSSAMLVSNNGLKKAKTECCSIEECAKKKGMTVEECRKLCANHKASKECCAKSAKASATQSKNSNLVMIKAGPHGEKTCNKSASKSN